MPKRKTAGQWKTFLRWLARSGNARLAARHAGMDVGTAYDRRIRDDSFAAKWAAALAEAKARPPSRRASADRDQDLVLRSGKDGDKLVKVGAGRWSPQAERRFLAALGRTGNVRAAAKACGFSTTALYYRREKYPQFAERWDAAIARAKQRIPDLLNAAAIAALDPEAADPDLPRLDVKDAIAICRLKGWGAGGRGRRPARAERPIEEVRASIMRKLDAIEAQEKNKSGAGRGSQGRDADG